MIYTLKLRYGQLLLRLIRLRAARREWATVSDLCDRFERVMASIPPQPLLWEGDYA
ncbi:MAG TPA: hypothetical protein VFH56_11230 [Acidimicrobiales bacterium]|nr:hypothetical protein [Acidimicrobiales bacterium]